jgi:hypothetical protein
MRPSVEYADIKYGKYWVDHKTIEYNLYFVRQKYINRTLKLCQVEYKHMEQKYIINVFLEKLILGFISKSF